MNIQKINHITTIKFSANIIDSHTHIGTHEGVNYTKQDLDIFTRTTLPNEDKIEKMLVSDLDVLHGTSGEYEGNKKALEIFKNSDKYALLASCNPQRGNIENIKKLFEENKGEFIGLKFHPQFQDLQLTDSKYEPYMEFAAENKLPCLFHSAVELIDEGKLNPNKTNISDPQLIYNLAKKYKDTPVVLAHMGAGYNEAHDKAIDFLISSIKKGDANLYADISWVDIDAENKDHIIKAIKRLKGIGEKDWTYGDHSFRLMFGTDAPLGRFSKENCKTPISEYTRFVKEIKSAIRKDKDLKDNAEKIIDDIFYNNAKKLYLKNTQNPTEPKSKNGLYLFCGVVIAILIGIYTFIHNKKINVPAHKKTNL